MPPERTATATLPVTSILPVISAASATAPPGSTTSFNSANAKGDRGGDLFVARHHAGADQRLVDREGELAGRARHQRIADGAGERGVLFALAAAERAGVVVEALRLGGVDRGSRSARLDGERDAGGQSAAGRGDHHDIGRKAERAEILDDLAAGGALAGDDQRVVIGRHQNGAASRGDFAGDRFAVVACAIVEHDFGAERRGALAFGARRVARHHDHARHAEEPCRGRNALGMIAGRERDDAADALCRRDRRELVIGAAELERSGALQRLGLEENPSAGQGVERGRGEKRRAQRDAGEPASSGLDIGGGGQGNRSVHDKR